MSRTAELPEGRNHAVKLPVSSILVSTAFTEGKSLAGTSIQKQFKQLTKAKLADKRSKGLCLTCDQKFTTGHSSVAGFTNNHTMRLRGLLGGEEIVVLIDSGASSNIISAHLVKKLGIQVTDTAPFSSILANGEIVRNQGICKGVIISFPELQVVEDFEHVKMGSASCQDVTLGIKWLKTLGDVMVNWQLRTMTFGSDTGKVTLKGDPGFTNNHLMRLKGILGEEEIVVLIDSGTSNNVISANLVERLGIMVTDTAPFSSILANGETVTNQGICKGVIISFPELQVVEDFKHFKMG
ncbi:hypothetical protein CTI12_AA332270 [Artemisia annua]|uniref:Uncharacterized protein n=1 Tax=Artemisia annua TaxID=35608 RepID=A0A2U1MWZ0_ARTAN|nr:hypothetical protein CTI12_AA332270 [Artemisia annua]